MTSLDLDELNAIYAKSSAEDIVKFAIHQFKDRLTLASSLGVEDQILTHMFANLSDEIDIFILDTGRLHQETYVVMDQSMKHYSFKYRIYFPDKMSVQHMVSTHGPNHFYESLENRKECCYIRKVEPLNRALSGYSAWMTGIRRAQSIDRSLTPLFEWDEAHQLVKINPLVAWSKQDVWTYVKAQKVPYNSLHDQGYPSIGCAPCTRAVKSGEDDRSGRWWWEEAVKKECGLHINLDERRSES